LHAVKQVLAPALLRTHHMTYGAFGQSEFWVHLVVHQPIPEPPLAQIPEEHWPLAVHGPPSGSALGPGGLGGELGLGAGAGPCDGVNVPSTVHA
jgi:hypothetical protein